MKGLLNNTGNWPCRNIRHLLDSIVIMSGRIVMEEADQQGGYAVVLSIMRVKRER